MDLNHYDDLIEATRDPDRLERIRQDVLADKSLSAADKDFLSGRIGMYLADADREAHPDGFTIEDVPDAGEE